MWTSSAPAQIRVGLRQHYRAIDAVEPGALRRVTTEEMDEEMKEVMEWARRIELSAGELGTT